VLPAPNGHDHDDNVLSFDSIDDAVLLAFCTKAAKSSQFAEEGLPLLFW
jgi:hypothetical protein